MRRWTTQEKLRQAELIHRWKLWQKAGVKTLQGKSISCMNAYKHGGYSKEIQAVKKMIADCRNFFKAINSY